MSAGARLHDTFLARSLAFAGSLGYSYRRALVPTFRAAVAGGYKRYLDRNLKKVSLAA